LSSGLNQDYIDHVTSFIISSQILPLCKTNSKILNVLKLGC